MKAILIHRAFEDRPVTTAIMEVDDHGFEKDLLEKFYRATQNIDDSWSNPDHRVNDGSDDIV